MQWERVGVNGNGNFESVKHYISHKRTLTPLQRTNTRTPNMWHLFGIGYFNVLRNSTSLYFIALADEKTLLLNRRNFMPSVVCCSIENLCSRIFEIMRNEPFSNQFLSEIKNAPKILHSKEIAAVHWTWLKSFSSIGQIDDFQILWIALNSGENDAQKLPYDKESWRNLVRQSDFLPAFMT